MNDRRVAWLLALLVGGAAAVYLMVHPPFDEILRTILGRAVTCAVCQPGVDSIADALAALILIVLALVAGVLASRMLDLKSYERPVAAGVFIYALISIPAAWVGGLGDAAGVALLRPPVGPLLAAIPSVLVLLVYVRRRRHTAPAVPGARAAGHGSARNGASGRGRFLGSRTALALGVIAATLLILSAGVSVSHPPYLYDELGYHIPLSILFWREGSLDSFFNQLSGQFLGHPGAAELWFGLVHMVGGEPVANLSQLPFAALAAFGITAFGRRCGLPRGAAIIGGMAFLLAPIVVVQVGFRNNDLVAAALIIASAAFASAPPTTWTRGRLGLIAIGLALSVTTKVAVIPIAFAIGLFVVVSLAISRLRANRPGQPASTAAATPATATTPASAASPAPEAAPATAVRRGRAWLEAHPRATALGLLAAIFLVGVAPWWLRNLSRFGNPIFPAAIPFLSKMTTNIDNDKDPAFVSHAIEWLFYPLIERQNQASGTGVLLAATILPGIYLAVKRGLRRPIALLATTLVIALPAWWLLTRHEPRFLLGIMGLALVSVPFVLTALLPPWRRVASVLLVVVAALGSIAIVIGPIAEVAALPVDWKTEYVQDWGVDPAVLDLPEDHPLVADVLCTNERLYPFLGEDQTRVVARPACGAKTATIVALLGEIGGRDVYATAHNPSQLDARYPPSLFTLVERSSLVRKHRTVERRLYLYTGTLP